MAIRESLIALTLTALLFFVNEFFALELPPIHFYGLMESLFYLQLTLTFDLDKSHTATLNGKSLTNEHTNLNGSEHSSLFSRVYSFRS